MPLREALNLPQGDCLEHGQVKAIISLYVHVTIVNLTIKIIECIDPKLYLIYLLYVQILHLCP